MRSMPNSHPEAARTAVELGRFLAQTFPTPTATVSPASQAPHPLLLLNVQHELAGFAVANADPRECFAQSYSFFKRLYADRHHEWDAFNVSFILCLGHRDPDLEAFCAEVETDALFCRKFTIALDAPWKIELARLPFFPLERGSGVFSRPPSAQALLKHCGVPAELATAMVGRVGEGTIVRDCLSGRFGEAKLVQVDPQKEGIPAGDEQPQAIRVQSMEIRNFRAYRRPQVFDLDADLIILYGPNGVGKTSFFDAIDFAATGDIGRLQLGTAEQRFTKAGTHLDATPDLSYVALAFRAKDGSHQIERTVQQRRKPRVDGLAVERKQALLTLTGAHDKVGADHIEHLVQLFRATHLFSQEFQTLTNEFRQFCRLSNKVVSRMLTFEDYVNGGRKASAVIALFQGRTADRDRRAQELTRALAADGVELQRLQTSGRSAENPEAVAALRDSVRQQLAAAGVNPQGESDAVAEARGWRAILEARISDAGALVSRLLGLATDAAIITTARARLSAHQTERAGTKGQLDAADEQVRQIRGAASRIEAELAALLERELGARQRAEAFAWQRDTKPAHETLVTRRAALTSEIGALTKALADHNASLEGLTTSLEAAEGEVARATSRQQSNRALLTSLKQLDARYPVWRQSSIRRQEVEHEISVGNAQLGHLREELRASQAALNEATLKERRAAEEVAQIQKTQSELQNLLAALQYHVMGVHCPACGIRHDSKEVLLLRLREQRKATAGSDQAISRLQQIRQGVAALTAAVDELTKKREALEGGAKRAADELHTLLAEVAAVEALVRTLDLDPGDTDLPARLQKRLAAEERTDKDLAQAAREQEAGAGAARTQLLAARAQAKAWATELAAKQKAFADATSQLERLRREAARLQVGLDTDLQETAEQEASTRRDAAAIAADTETKRTELTKTRGSLGERERHAQALRQQLDMQDAALLKTRRRIEKYQGELQALGLGQDAQEAEITARAAKETDRVNALETLKQSVIGLEMGLDAALTSAASERLYRKVRADERELGKLRAQQAQDGPWIAYFERLQENLRHTQDDAVARYTDRYGPLTSIVQRRLRSVSGFEEISLAPEAGGIQVRVTRNGEYLPPTDFFSQSQQQILMLSLFLTACITQTWSAFAPVLLDDPVTHFDDLNGYSFLDLIGGLIETEPNARQFVLSTCDEQLFQLARQRFHHLAERVKVYRFVAAGRDGPVIEQM